MLGATLSKGINRAIGTILGGGLGCLAALLGDKFGRVGNAVVVATSVFVIGNDAWIPYIPTASSYLSQKKEKKKKYIRSFDISCLFLPSCM